MHFVSVSVINSGSMHYMSHASSMKRSRISSIFKAISLGSEKKIAGKTTKKTLLPK